MGGSLGRPPFAGEVERSIDSPNGGDVDLGEVGGDAAGERGDLGRSMPSSILDKWRALGRAAGNQRGFGCLGEFVGCGSV
jgi:hypothetical protein